MNNLVSFIVGLIFAFGLAVSGMTQPQKVIGFLDIFGQWDPSLMFVMMGAICVHFFTFKLILRRPAPVLAAEWLIPSKREITPNLVLGSVLFGLGWGLGGFCPGPAVTALASLESRPLVFVTSMIVGMFVFRIANNKISFRR